MSHFADYKAEKEGKLVLENESGFLVYYFQKDTCIVEDLYVVPEKRRMAIATQMLDFIGERARSLKCKKIFVSVSPSSKGSEQSLHAAIKYGFKIHSAQYDLINFMKDL